MAGQMPVVVVPDGAFVVVSHDRRQRTPVSIRPLWQVVFAAKREPLPLACGDGVVVWGPLGDIPKNSTRKV